MTMMTFSAGSQALASKPVSFEGAALREAGLLRSSVSGQPCVYWRVRIAEHLTARTELVHEPATASMTWGILAPS